jgi:surface antigen
MKKKLLLLSIFIGLAILTFIGNKNFFLGYNYDVGTSIDSLNGVAVYYNGPISNVEGRNTKNGYNIGLKYQCVEFVKRYYFEHLNHKMPDSYGHAKSFFEPHIKDGRINKTRNLTQFTNPSKSKPKVDDLIVMGSSEYGHVAIVSSVSDNSIEIIQQNPGISTSSRASIRLTQNKDGMWYIEKERILGWLRK